MEWEGRRVEVASPAAARRLGIGMVFQHFALFETLTVAENVALAMDGAPRPADLAPRIVEVSRRYGLPVDPGRVVHSMSVGERQRVEIVRCLLQSPRLLIMDEPTSVLTPQAVTTLFDTLRQLAAEGVSILYISHKLDEIRALCHRATVLRGGRVTGEGNPRDLSNRQLAEMMIGRELAPCVLPRNTPGEVRLALRGVSASSPDPFGTSLRDISLDVRAGEIVGIAGVSGNGQKELVAAISGEVPRLAAGTIEIAGTDIRGLDPRQRRALGFSFVPEERLGRGAVPSLSLAENALLTGAAQGLVRGGVIRRAVADAFATDTIAAFDVRGGSAATAAGSLSGGNLQKFIVGREIRLAPRVMLVTQPTWGVDVGAAQRIREALIALRADGVAVLVVSEELEELFQVCDRIAVIAGGRLSPAEPAGTLGIERIGALMAAGAADTAGAVATTGAAHG